MREISAAQIEETVCRLCIEANRHLPADVCAAVRGAGARETQPGCGGCFGADCGW